jgi:KaiC/GvpD/RAD55 family RecA-like ATPase
MPDSPAAHDALRGSNLLVTGPPLAGKGRFVVEQTRTAADPVLVTTRTPDRLLDDPGLGGSMHVVDCSPGETRLAGAVDVGSPADLTGISMPVSRLLGDADRPVLAVDSVSSLLIYADVAPLFRFLSVLASQIADAGGLGLYTLDTDCHDRRAAATLAELFDGRIEIDAHGEVASTVGLPGSASAPD